MAASPTPFSAPEGEPAGEAETEAVRATAREIVACLNAGDYRRVYALYTDDYLTRNFTGETTAQAQAIAVPTDVSEPGEVEPLADASVARFGRIDVWLNNAGSAAIGRFEEVPLADHIQVINTDLIGVIAGSHVAMRQFRRQGAGTLISVSSVLGKMPAPYWASYAAAKFGIVGLNGALRQELEENGVEDIHVCTVLPMTMDTPFFEHAANYTGHEATPIPPVFDPMRTVEAIVKLVNDPQDEVVVGPGGTAMTTVHAVAPGMTEKLLGKETHVVQTKAPPTAPTAGSLHEPQSDCAGIHGDAD